jgi:hypothetical protein
MTIGEYSIGGYWWLLMAISGYFIGKHWWLIMLLY